MNVHSPCRHHPAGTGAAVVAAAAAADIAAAGCGAQLEGHAEPVTAQRNPVKEWAVLAPAYEACIAACRC